jgi:hypothetical protein
MPTKALPGRLSPEWVDEEEETDIPSCPSLPDPIFPRDPQFDVVAIKLPCTRVAGVWSRDVARLHLQLSAAKLGVARWRGNSAVHVLFVTECFPIPKLGVASWRGNSAVKGEGNAWLYLYKPDFQKEKETVFSYFCQIIPSSWMACRRFGAAGSHPHHCQSLAPGDSSLGVRLTKTDWFDSSVFLKFGFRIIEAEVLPKKQNQTFEFTDNLVRFLDQLK